MPRTSASLLSQETSPALGCASYPAVSLALRFVAWCGIHQDLLTGQGRPLGLSRVLVGQAQASVLVWGLTGQGYALRLFGVLAGQTEALRPLGVFSGKSWGVARRPSQACTVWGWLVPRKARRLQLSQVWNGH